MFMPTILIVDDEATLLKYLQKQFYTFDYNIVTAARGEEALDIYEKQKIDLILLDVRLPDISGIEILKKIRETDPWLPIIIMTAYSGIQGAIEAIRFGANDYIAKPFDFEELRFIIEKCIESQQAVAEVSKIRSRQKEEFSFNKIITISAKMTKLIELMMRLVDKTQSTVLIMGESGTGKELFASSIHYSDKGVRSKGPFVTVNCGALSSGILESELFGHEKGAFTGAVKQKKGYFEVADKGTIFLDEIGEMDPKTQVGLLRFLEGQTFQRVGGTRDISVDVRIIAATNKNLLEEVQNGTFREDLYYRLNVIVIPIPPLRERKEDIPLLIDHYIRVYNKALNKEVTGCTHEALNVLMDYRWPGNVRELRNMIERAVLISENEFIKPSDLPIEIYRSRDESEVNMIKYLSKMKLDKLIKLYVENILAEYKGNITHAARVLDITRERLKRILSKSYE